MFRVAQHDGRDGAFVTLRMTKDSEQLGNEQ